MTPVAPSLLLYDADCGFCQVSLALVLAWDRREQLRPLALQDPEASRLLSPMASERQMASWHLVSAAGDVRSAGAALAPLLAELPGGAPLAALSARVPGAAERAYRWVADRRSGLGRPLPERVRRWASVRIAQRS